MLGNRSLKVCPTPYTYDGYDSIYEDVSSFWNVWCHSTWITESTRDFFLFGYDVAILYDTNTQDECRERHSPLNQTGKLVRNQTKPTTSAFARMSRSSCTQIFPVSWTHYLLEGYCYLCSTVNCKTKKSMCFETHKGIPANGFPRRIDTPPAWILDRMLWYPTRHKLRINSRFKPHIIIILLLSQCEFEIRLKNGKWLLLIEANTCVAWWCLVVL